MPWKVPLFSETGELEWFEASGAPSVKLRPDLKADERDLAQVERDEAGRRYEEMANANASGPYAGYFNSYGSRRG